MSLVTAGGRSLVCAAVVVLTGQTAITAMAEETPPADLLLVSSSASGEAGNGLSSFGMSVSASGRYVAFGSLATNLDPADTDSTGDVYVKDLSTGEIRLVSQTAEGVKGNSLSSDPSISADGELVAFVSAADNLSPDDTDGHADVFVKDLRTGAVTLASRNASGTKGAGPSTAAALAADGSAVAFSSSVTNLLPEATDGESHVYVKRLDTGALTLADGGTIVRPDEQIGATGPSISADGHAVSFSTDAAGLDPADTDRVSDVYVRDLESGVVRLISVNGEGVKGDRPSNGASLSADGTRVAFASAADNLVPEDPPGPESSSDVYVKALTDGSLRLASTDTAGTKANRTAAYPALSPDGRFLAFATDATNLGIDTPPLVHQVYRKDLDSGELLPASVGPGGVPPGDYLSIDPAIAAGGAVVAFVTPSTNLLPDGDNRWADVFAKLFNLAPPPPPPPPLPPPSPSPSPPPVAGEITASPSTLTGASGPQLVVLRGTASASAGVDHVSFTVIDEYGSRQPTVRPVVGGGQSSVTWKRTVSLSTWMRRDDPTRTYEITAEIRDAAGNVTSASTQVVVARCE